ncbi:MAG: hypothetical protein Q9199_002504 [Rusavskia elegans]
MPPRTKKVHRPLRDLDDAAESTSPSPSQSASPPALQHQDAAHNAISVDQSHLPKGFSTSPQHQRIKSVISSHQPTTTPPVQGQQRLASSPSALLGNTQPLLSAQESYFSSQPGISGIEARSPANKRAPASRSSHGIPTANGPPPALITQRSYHGDPWRNPIPTDQPDLPTASHPHPQPQTSRTTLAKYKESGSNPAYRNSTGPRTTGAATSDAMNSSEAERSVALNAPQYRQRHDADHPDDDDDETLRIVDGSKLSTRHLTNGANKANHNGGQEDDHSYSSHEDLFLHLARADSEAGNNSDSTKKFGRRGSDFGVSTYQPVRTARQVSNRPASSSREFAGDKVSRWSRSSQIDTPTNGRYSSPREQKYAASAHPLDQRNHGYLPSDLSSKPSFTSPRVRNYSNRDTSPEMPASSGRRQSIAGSRSGTRPRTYNQSARSHISGNYYDSSPIAQDTRLHQAIPPDDTESTTSTTAPSTVWDELDDLKSRIRKLELTGKLPSSSSAAIASVANDRPRTATTTMTTASSSPKDRIPKNVSPEASTVKGTDTSNLHPLLHSALAKAKPLINPKAYRALETTASDALTLAAMTGAAKSAGQQTSAQDASRVNNRHIRRKADSTCRGLTELCIALCEEKTSTESPTANAQTGSREYVQDNTNGTPFPEDPPRVRASSQDPNRPSSRIISRLEARRSSLLASNAFPSTTLQPNNQSDSPTIQQHNISTPAQPNPHSSRSSVPLHRRRTADSNTDTVTLHSRSGSRSTEQRPSLPTRMSREFTSQHPIPTLSNSTNQRRSPSIHSSSGQRKSYFPYYVSTSNHSSNNNSPSTPLYNNNNNSQPGNWRYLSSERQTTPASADENQRRAAERQQRIGSLGQYSGGRRLRLVEGEQGRVT